MTRDWRASLRWLGIVTTLGMFAVLIMGSDVTNTGSEQGCGHSWPLCHGQLIPQMAVHTAIEFSHRAMVGVESILIIALAIGCLMVYRNRREMRILVPLMVGFLFIQAGLGAWAVMYPQEPAILALHFGVSSIAFASVLLTTMFLFEADDGRKLRNRPIPVAFSGLIWAVTAYSYLVMFLGAYVRHTASVLACLDWPLCNGQVLPSMQGPVGTNFTHRLAAGILTLAVLALVLWSWRLRQRRPDLLIAAAVALTTVLLQALSGALVVVTRLDLFSALAHAGLAGLLFGSLTYLCLHTLPESEPRVVSMSVPLAAPSGARQ